MEFLEKLGVMEVGAWLEDEGTGSGNYFQQVTSLWPQNTASALEGHGVGEGEKKNWPSNVLDGKGSNSHEGPESPFLILV